MIKILDNTKTLTELSQETSNGLGQFQPISAYVTEELNGIFEAEITMLDNDKHFGDIKVNSILSINSGEVIGNQMFRIYYISKPINHLITIKAQHITYDLNKVAIKPFTSQGAVSTKNGLLANTIGEYPFNMTTNIDNTTSKFTLDIPRTFRETLGGYKGSVLDVFKCEYEWDNLTVKMLAKRGADNGVRISYGKNLTDFKQEENIENVYTAVLGYAVVDEVTYIGEVYYKVETTYPKIKIIDFSEDYNNDDGTSYTPSAEDLTYKAQRYAERNDIEIPNVNFTISFVPLYQTDEYKNIAPLERVGLGDTVHVYFERLGIEASSRVIKTVWNVNLNRYDSIELGNTKANLNTVINEVVEDTTNEIIENLNIDTSYVEGQLNQMSSLIINGIGLHKTVDSIGRIYLHNEENLEDSQYQYIITAQGFMMSDDYGQTWNSGWDTSGNAVMNALSTVTLKALEIYGSYIQGSQIVFGNPLDDTSKYIIAQPYANNSNVVQGVSFDGTGTIRLQPQEAFYVNNQTADGSNNYNRIIMNKLGSYSQNFIELVNYDDTQNYIIANLFELDAHFVSGGSTYNRLLIRNNATISGTAYASNMVLMNGYENQNQMYIRNYKAKSTAFANYVMLTCTTTTNTLQISNRKFTSDAEANTLQLTSTSYTNQLGIYNYQLESNNFSNYITWSAISSTNSFYLRNFEVGTNQVGNVLYFQSYTDRSVFYMNNGKDPSNTGNANQNTIALTHNRSTSTNSIRIVNNVLNTSTIANSIVFTADNSGNTLRLTNRNASGVETNYIEMSSSSSFMSVYSLSDLRLTSGGAVRLTSGSSQDITLTSADDIYITANDKVYLTISGEQHTLAFSNGYVTYS